MWGHLVSALQMLPHVQYEHIRQRPRAWKWLMTKLGWWLMIYTCLQSCTRGSPHKYWSRDMTAWWSVAMFVDRSDINKMFKCQPRLPLRVHLKKCLIKGLKWLELHVVRKLAAFDRSRQVWLSLISQITSLFAVGTCPGSWLTKPELHLLCMDKLLWIMHWTVLEMALATNKTFPDVKGTCLFVSLIFARCGNYIPQRAYIYLYVLTCLIFPEIIKYNCWVIFLSWQKL